MARRVPQILIAAGLAATVALSACGSDDSEATTGDTTDTTEPAGEAVSDEPTEALPATSSEPDVEPTIAPDDADEPDDETDDLSELDGLDVGECAAPGEQEFYVDVALDDPDGGLNMRTAPGVEHDIVGVFPRSDALTTTGGCATVKTVDWWKMRTLDGDVEGWVSSRYLSEFLVFNPGVGKAIDDLDNVGASAPTLDELAAMIAESYGFDDDVTIVMTSGEPAIDAQGGTATFEMTGLKDDASNGFIVDIDFAFDKDEDDGGAIVGYTATKVTNYSLCSRGVTEDGLCT